MEKLKLEEVSLTVFEQNKNVSLLDKVSLTIEQGTINSLIGPSGSGKSSLLFTINRLKEINHGKILLDGKNINEIDVYNLRRRIGLVQQKPAFFEGTVRENILYGPKIWSMKTPDLGALLKWVGLDSEILNRNPNTLSGGQQQRVALARTLANKPEFLLLDEPTSALDEKTKVDLEDLILELSRKNHMTVIWVTHDMHQAKRIADYVYLLIKGQIVDYNSAEVFFNGPQTKQGIEY